MHYEEYTICGQCGDPMFLHHEQDAGVCDKCYEPEPEDVEGFRVVGLVGEEKTP